MKQSIAARLSAAFFAFVLAFSCAPMAYAAEVDSGNFGTGNALHWSLDSNGTLTISGSGAMPNETPGSEPWSAHSADVRAVSVSSGVTAVGNYEFYQYPNLTTVSLPSSLTSIGRIAFSDCPSLTSVSMAEGVTSIGTSAFLSCSNLNLSSLPTSITTIGDQAFSGCINVSFTQLPSSLTSIGGAAFNGCTTITSLTIPAGVTNIGSGAFARCQNLASLTFEGATAPALGGALSDKAGLTINIPAGATGYTAAAGWPVDDIMWPISVAAAPGGSANVTATAAKPGTRITLVATPDRGFRLAGFTMSPSSVTVTDSAFTMPAQEVVVTPRFEDISHMRFKVTVEGSSASASGTGEYVAGEVVRLDAGTREGYHFTGWTSNDGVVFANALGAQSTFLMPDRDVTVTAQWEADGESGGNDGEQGGNDEGGTTGGANENGGEGSSEGDSGSDEGTAEQGGQEVNPFKPTADTLPQTGDNPVLVAMFFIAMVAAAGFMNPKREKLAPFRTQDGAPRK